MQYLKIYTSYVANFWICCVLGHEKLLCQKFHKVMQWILLNKLFSIPAETA
jgi:hypothetical protein